MSERQFWGVASLIVAFILIDLVLNSVLLGPVIRFPWRYWIPAMIFFWIARSLMIGKKDKPEED